MNSCLNCSEPVTNKYCNVSCQNKHQGSIRANKKYGFIKDFEVKCNCCDNKLMVEERENLFPKKKKYFCSKSCANKREHSKETKENIRFSLNGNKIIKLESTCIQCKCKFIKKRNKQKFCSRSCSSSWNNIHLGIGRIAGLASVKSQSENRRSKNEIYFAEMCQNKFHSVLINEQMFNGWDADVIIEDIKVAVLWNGRWHYNKITELHSVERVQNRDKIKIKEIELKGYLPYVIKDMGKENNEFVKKEFEKFIDYLKHNSYICV